MALLKILIFPDPRLRTVAKTVELVDDSIKKLAQDMLETMYQGSGIGLAATQVNVHKRVIVLDISESKDEPLILINPEIINSKSTDRVTSNVMDVLNKLDCKACISHDQKLLEDAIAHYTNPKNIFQQETSVNNLLNELVKIYNQPSKLIEINL